MQQTVLSPPPHLHLLIFEPEGRCALATPHFITLPTSRLLSDAVLGNAYEPSPCAQRIPNCFAPACTPQRAAAEHLRAYGTGWAACLASSIPSLMGAAQVRAPSVRPSRENTPLVLETLSLRPCRPWSPSSSWASRCPWCQLQIYTYGEYVPCQETTVVCAMASDALDCVLTTRSRLHLCAQALTTEFRDHKPGRR